MKIYKLFFLSSLVSISISHSIAGEIIVNQTMAEPGHIITKKIDLTPAIKSFREILANQLNKRDCEKKIFVKKAKLSTVKGLLVVEIQVRITRQYCTRRAKTQLYEKTSTISYKYQVEVDENRIALREVGNNSGKASFLKSFKDVLEKDPSKRIAEILSSIIDPQFDAFNKSMELKENINSREATVVTNKILIEFTSMIDLKNTHHL